MIPTLQLAGRKLKMPAAAGGSYSALLHFNGADGSTTITDESGKSWVAVGSAQIDTAQSQFGGASLLVDGNGDYVSSPVHADFGFGTGDWQIEGWFRQTANNTNAFFADFRQVGGNSFVIWCSQTTYGSKLGFSDEIGTNYIPHDTPFAVGTWTHWAATRVGGTIRLFVGGVLGSTTTTDSRDLGSSQGVHIGSSTFANQGAIGNIDEVRILKAPVSPYTANFTPPAGPF
jgi:hypothetical protein